MGDADERRKSRVEMENLSLDTNRFSSDLLQRFMGSTSEKNDQLDVAKKDDQINEDELNLGLSLGGRFGVDKTSSNLLVRSSSMANCLPTIRDDDALEKSSPPVTYNNSSLVRTSSLPVESEAEWRKRKELQSFRRMEAKRRRSEKVQRNLNLRGEKCMEEEKRGTDQVNLRGKLEKEQFLASAKKFGCKLPTLAGADVSKGKGSYMGSDKMQEKKKPASQGSMESQGGCSSGISELESKPAEGSAKASPPSIHSLQKDFGSKKAGGETEISPCNRVDTTKSQVQKTGANALGDMPCVFTKGDGPNGRRIDGILYKYGKGEEIKIMCVCHGSFLSPAEFVKHAGGSDVAHPLKHIVIKPNPSPFL
ncbi:ninja-family protein AFP1-like isoform X1 [Lycium barbarum]|uniref:ninja-family protein AFP1-like isoform X1 n=1 Tax=Lycium barbarum TaxID=112863 RepID=UPI00293F3F50|nr:ninja-family protein AFP1-like isoform X1 [Lycium barbarum]